MVGKLKEEIQSLISVFAHVEASVDGIGTAIGQRVKRSTYGQDMGAIVARGQGTNDIDMDMLEPVG